MQNNKCRARRHSAQHPLPPGEGGGEGCCIATYPVIPAQAGIQQFHCQRGFADRIEARAALQGRNVGGFSYAVLLIAVIVIALAAEVAVQTTTQVVKRDREDELLYRGDQYRRAIKSYYEAGIGTKRYPPSLEDLLIDPRFQGKRHIRQLYPDPMDREGKGEWKLIRATDGGIKGVISSSEDKPLKQANFPPGMERFSGAGTYAAWTFEHVPTVAGARPVLSPPTATPPSSW
mgnify:FL=1